MTTMTQIPDLGGNGKGVAFTRQVNVTGNLTSATFGLSARISGMFNANLSGTFVATLALERSLDNGLTWNQVTAGGAAYTFSAPCQEIFDEAENSALYRWNCISYTSGTISYRISQ